MESLLDSGPQGGRTRYRGCSRRASCTQALRSARNQASLGVRPAGEVQRRARERDELGLARTWICDRSDGDADIRAHPSTESRLAFAIEAVVRVVGPLGADTARSAPETKLVSQDRAERAAERREPCLAGNEVCVDSPLQQIGRPPDVHGPGARMPHLIDLRAFDQEAGVDARR